MITVITAGVMPLETSVYLKRASTDALYEIFQKYASHTKKNGEIFLTSEDFIRKFLGLYPEDNFNSKSVDILAGVVDTSKDGLISFPEFTAFEAVLCGPDALYRTAFQLFDIGGTGLITFDEFANVVKQTVLHEKVPFDLDGDFVKLYFGRNKERVVTYVEFSQFLHDFHGERAKQAFKKYDTNGQGFIAALDFHDIMSNVKSHLLTPIVKANLVAAVSSTGGFTVTYPFFIAFNHLLSSMELIKRIFLNATNNDRTAEVTKEEFLRSAQMMSGITPMEISILFTLADLIHHSGGTEDRSLGRLSYSDIEAMAPEQYLKAKQFKLAEVKMVQKESDRSVLVEVLESAYRFSLGAVAGAVGATAVYPIDLVKTRIQNQRAGELGELMYRNSADCFKKVIRHEGFTGLYRGLVPQLVGVAPEKAIKLTMNDLVRGKFTDRNGHIPVWAEVLAGGTGGCCQVMFTNPLEIVKIRLQVAGEIASQRRIGAGTVIKELGFLGLYKGASACLMRDIPFSMIYFPVYAHAKKWLATDDGYNAPWTLLVAGAIGGMPAASLTTPADVIKTRLQVAARAGQTTYRGIPDAFAKILQQEGFGAFWKGAPARVFRSSPQFGVTLLTYELLQRVFDVDFGGLRPQGSEQKVATMGMELKESDNPDHIGGYRVALPILSGIESKFGLFLPKYKVIETL